MNVCKIFLALALFVSSVSFEEQVLVGEQGLVSNWEVTIGTSDSFAAQAKAAMKFE